MLPSSDFGRQGWIFCKLGEFVTAGGVPWNTDVFGFAVDRLDGMVSKYKHVAVGMVDFRCASKTETPR